MTGRISGACRRWRYRGARRKTDAWRTDLIVITVGALLVAGLVTVLDLLLFGV